MATKITRSQQLTMVEFLECHKSMVCGKFPGPNDRQINLALWRELAELLNTDEVGPSKSVEKWMKTWQDWRSFLKKTAKRNLASGGGKLVKPFTDLEVKVLQLIRESAVADIKVENVESHNLTENSANRKRQAQGSDSNTRLPKISKPTSDKLPIRAEMAMEQIHFESIAKSLSRIANCMEKTVRVEERRNEIFEAFLICAQSFVTSGNSEK